MTRLARLRAWVVGHQRLTVAFVYAAIALVVGFVVADPGDRAGYLAGVAFALAAAIVVLFALEAEEETE